MSQRRPIRPRGWHMALLVAVLLLVGVMVRSKATSAASPSGETTTTPAAQKIVVNQAVDSMVPPSQKTTKASVRPLRDCDFAGRGGWWEKQGMIDGDGDGDTTTVAAGAEPTKAAVQEHLLHWHPAVETTEHCLRRDGSSERTWRRFDQVDALRCLQGKNVLLYGNSNTRTIYIALEALLRNKRMTSRVAAKQLCDNSRTNHSCWVTIEIKGYKPITVTYISYVQDLFHEELDRKIPMAKRRTYDLIIGNSGLNVIQNGDDKKVREDHLANVPHLKKFIASFARRAAQEHNDTRHNDPVFLWHATTPICVNQPHFKRYLYNAKHWRYRSVDKVNEAVVMTNRIVFESVFGVPFATSVESTGDTASMSPLFTVDGMDLAVVDDWSMAVKRLPHGMDGSPAFDLCPLFEDPLHHRFLDREVVQNMLNVYCPISHN